MIKAPKVEHREVREIDPAEFPKYGTRGMQIRFLLQYAILAPSSHNTQPWKFRIHDNKVDVFADYGKQLDIVDPKNRELFISCGAALGVFQHAARYFGCTAHVSLNNGVVDGLPLASIELLAGSPANDEETQLFYAISKRSTQRAAFADVPPDIEDIEDCAVIASYYDTELCLGSDGETKQALANLIANGDRVQYSNPDFRKELAIWLKSKKIGGHDGISADSFGLPDILTPLGSLIVKSLNLGSNVGASHEKQIKQPATMFGVLSSQSDEVKDLLNTGMSLSHLLLHLTSRGLCVSFFNEPIEVKALRKELAKLLASNHYPQMIFRIGYGPTGSFSNRRALEDCIIDSP